MSFLLSVPEHLSQCEIIFKYCHKLTAKSQKSINTWKKHFIVYRTWHPVCLSMPGLKITYFLWSFLQSMLQGWGKPSSLLSSLAGPLTLSVSPKVKCIFPVGRWLTWGSGSEHFLFQVMIQGHHGGAAALHAISLLWSFSIPYISSPLFSPQWLSFCAF